MISFGRLLKLVMFLQIQSFVIQSKCLGFLWTEIKKKKEKKNQFRSTLGGRTDTADSSASGLYLSLFGLTLATSQWILRLICSCRSSIQCCYADLWTAAQEKRHKLLQQADSQPRNNLHDHKEHLYNQHVFRSFTILICRKQPGRLHGFQC